MTGILFPDPMPAVQAFLRADPGVAALVKDRVTTRPSDRQQPPLVRLDDGGGINLVEDRLDRWRIQVQCLVPGIDKQTEARTLARHTRAAFDRMPGHFVAAQIPSVLRLDGTAGTFASCSTLGDLIATAATLSVEVDVALDDWSPAANDSLLSQWGGVGNLAFLLAVHPASLVQMLVPHDGSTLSPAEFEGQAFADGTRHVVGVDVVGDNGSSQSTFQFTADGANLGSLKLNAQELGSGLSGSSAAVVVGGRADGAARATGDFYSARIWADGVLVAAPDFTDLQPGHRGTVTDPQGNVWTLNGHAVAALQQPTGSTVGEIAAAEMALADGIVITDVDTTMPQVIPLADPPDGKAGRPPQVARATFTALVHYRPNP